VIQASEVKEFPFVLETWFCSRYTYLELAVEDAPHSFQLRILARLWWLQQTHLKLPGAMRACACVLLHYTMYVVVCAFWFSLAQALQCACVALCCTMLIAECMLGQMLSLTLNGAICRWQPHHLLYKRLVLDGTALHKPASCRWQPHHLFYKRLVLDGTALHNPAS